MRAVSMATSGRVVIGCTTLKLVITAAAGLSGFRTSCGAVGCPNVDCGLSVMHLMISNE
jgi:hypothetical protein